MPEWGSQRLRVFIFWMDSFYDECMYVASYLLFWNRRGMVKNENENENEKGREEEKYEHTVQDSRETGFRYIYLFREFVRESRLFFCSLNNTRMICIIRSY